MSVTYTAYTTQRAQIDGNAAGVASMMNGLRLNARQLKTWLDTFDDPTLLAAPYSYTTDELYALRLFTQLVQRVRPDPDRGRDDGPDAGGADGRDRHALRGDDLRARARAGDVRPRGGPMDTTLTTNLLLFLLLVVVLVGTARPWFRP